MKETAFICLKPGVDTGVLENCEFVGYSAPVKVVPAQTEFALLPGCNTGHAACFLSLLLLLR